LAIDGSGHLSVGKNTPDGRYEVAGEAGSLRALAVIEVASANRYDDLLRQETIGINEPPPSTGIESGTANLGVRTAQGEDLSKRRRNAFILIVIGVPAIVAALALLVGHRFRRSAISNARESGDGLGNTLNLSGDRGPSRPQDRVRDADAPPPVDASRPVAPVDEGSPDNRGPKGKICPACGERYDASASFCGKDGASLVLLN
jgi:hypothetical protein